ncbi:hypothetical protein ACWD4O_39505 [Streptomyces sp. NPDC002623]
MADRMVVVRGAAAGGAAGQRAQRRGSVIGALRTRCMEAGLLRPDVSTATPT